MPLSSLTNTWPLLLGMGILMLGAGLQGTLLSLRATLEGFPTPVTGAIMSCYYVGYLLGTLTAPRLLRQVGHIRVFAALAAIASAAILVQASFIHPVVWGLMRLLSGLCFAGIYVVAESWLNDRASHANRGSLFAIYMLTLYVGLGAAQFLLVLANPRTPTPFMLVSVLVSLAMVPIVISAQKTPEIAVPSKVHYRDLYRNSPLGVVAVTLSGMISSIIFSMGPVYSRLSGHATTGVAAFMAVSILAAVLTQYPIGRLSDRIDRRTVIAIVCALATIVAASVAAFGPLPRGAFLLLTALFSGSALTLYSLAVSHVNDKLEPAQMIAASSSLLMLNGASAAIGPVLAGSLMAAFGPPAYFATLATLTGLLTLYDLWRKVRRKPVPPAQKGPFISAHPQGLTGQIAVGAEIGSRTDRPSELASSAPAPRSDGSIRADPYSSAP
ncbi:MAG TPA: MFS transporter [Steroidobacteraceae bacterium]|nr:MFS transporter [Steroidobacteraceae bacterium]